MNLSKSSLLANRRAFLTSVGAAGIGAMALSPFAHAQQADPEGAGIRRRKSRRRDLDILNFALNLEYLEAEFYLRATTGQGLADADIGGEGQAGGVTVPGDTRVDFQSDAIRQYAEEITADEVAHVRFLRSALGDAAVARPAINLRESFTAAAMAAGLIEEGETFDPFADELSFLLGAFLFEDVGVTAYAGAAPLILDPAILSASARILAVEAYHASNARTVLFNRGENDAENAMVVAATAAISDARDALDDPDTDKDQPVVLDGKANIVPTDENGLAFARTPKEVLNIVYLNPMTQPGGFFPQGVNGQIR